jgi:hypothetical protein
VSTFTTRDNLRFDALEAVRKFLTADVRDSAAVFDTISAFEDAEGTDFTMATQFCTAAGFDPDRLLDTDGQPSIDVDALMDLADDLDQYVCAETPDPFDTWAEARGER